MELAVRRIPMTVSLLASPRNDPLVRYGAAGTGVFVEGAGSAPIPIDECQTRPGGYLSSSATNVGIPGFWLGYWTKFGEETASEPGFITTDGRGLACSSEGCTTAIQGECNTTLDNAVRNVAVGAAVRPGDPTGLVHLVQVTPLVGVDEETTQAYAGLVATAALSSLRPRVKP